MENQSIDKKYVRDLGDGIAEVDLIVPTMHCAGCMSKIEGGFKGQPGIERARANLSTKRVALRFKPSHVSLSGLIARLEGLGFEASPFDAELVDDDRDRESRALLLALAVAGFASMNIMLLSVSVWSGSDMDGETQAMFHWISAIIAVLAISYSGRPFFRSAYRALKVRSVNMDVPISLAVLLATLSSIYEAATGGEHVYFDAGVMLLFFLLIGRYLDHRMRARATSAAQNLLALKAVPATVINEDGSTTVMAADTVIPGTRVMVATGMRVPVDGTVLAGESEIDTSLVTGETVPKKTVLGDQVFAGTLNLGAAITVQVTSRGEHTLLAEIVRLLEAAEQGRSKYVRLADRLAKAYAPAVHLLAATTFFGWFFMLGEWHTPLMRAIAVLIITCPCALGLAVPVVQVVASARLLSKGILVKAADGLERLAAVDTIVFDKTGTLTLGELRLNNRNMVSDDDLKIASAMGATSHHPLSKAIAVAGAGLALPLLENVQEITGSGIEATLGGASVKLGRRAYVGVVGDASSDAPELWLQTADGRQVLFTFADELRSDAAEIIGTLKQEGYEVHLLSGDRLEVASAVAKIVGIDSVQADQRPDEKINFIEALKNAGKTVLMVGDGLNDAPALRAANVSISPSSATDITQTAADFIFQGQKLASLIEVIDVAKKTKRLVFENFALALGYNIIAVPLAIFGFVTPLIAALAMSSSSIIVTVNALRLKWVRSRAKIMPS